MTLDYDAMLKRGREKLPEDVVGSERFEVPKVVGHIQGNRTVINNFHAIAAALNREPNHVLKYVLKQLATPGELSKTALIMGAKVPASRINEKVQQYVREYVLCQVCRRPDTKLVREGNVAFMKCAACGAQHVAK